jgi:site-specific DNA-methyltransferase (adenine-specific)
MGAEASRPWLPLVVHETLVLPGLVDDAQRTNYTAVNSDAIKWLREARPKTIHAVVTDPPYGMVEYLPEQLEKKDRRKGGVWRMPPKLDGVERSPLPRFTVLTHAERTSLEQFFDDFAKVLYPVLVPGAHVMIASNPLVSHFVYGPLMRAGFEKRGEIIRLVQTLRGGDRPKNAHEEFGMVSVMPRSGWEPWGLFRKPCEGRVQDNLRKWKAGGLRRISDDVPFRDVVTASPARGRERQIAPHPSIKPQALMRQLVRAALPLAEGVVLDPFMGSGSTVAAAVACGYESIGIEVNPEYYMMAIKAIPRLAALLVAGEEGN